MKADTIRCLHSERCSPEEIGIVVGLRSDRVRYFINNGCKWTNNRNKWKRQRSARDIENDELCRLARACGF